MGGASVKLGIENGAELTDYINAVEQVDIDRFGLGLDTTHPVDTACEINPLTQRDQAQRVNLQHILAFPDEFERRYGVATESAT